MLILYCCKYIQCIVKSSQHRMTSFFNIWIWTSCEFNNILSHFLLGFYMRIVVSQCYGIKVYWHLSKGEQPTGLYILCVRMLPLLKVQGGYISRTKGVFTRTAQKTWSSSGMCEGLWYSVSILLYIKRSQEVEYHKGFIYSILFDTNFVINEIIASVWTCNISWMLLHISLLVIHVCTYQCCFS